jgi:hypothetical protein
VAETVFPVRETLDKIVDKASKEGRIPPASAEHGPGALLPSFSKGTMPLDDHGATIEQRVPPAFETAHVDLPASTETTGAAPSSATPAAKEPGPVVGRAATPTTPAVAAPAAGATEAPAAAAVGAAAAESAAAAVEEMADILFRDPDLDLDIPIKVPKRFEETVKRGYGRRTAMDRSLTFVKEAEPVLKEYIETGAIRDLLPLIQFAKTNEPFAQFVSEAFRRAQAGLPLAEQVRNEAALAHAVAATETAAAPAPPENPFEDPSVAELRQRLAAIDARDREREEAQRRQQTEQQQRQARLQAHNSRMAFAHNDLAGQYPGVFNPALGERDPNFDRAYQYALSAGYFQTYQDPAAAVRFGWYGVQQLDAERAAALQSPAATALAAVDTRMLDAAAREARDSASTVAGGAVATSVMPAPPPKPSTKDAAGKLKPQEVYMSEVLAWERQFGRLKGA